MSQTPNPNESNGGGPPPTAQPVTGVMLLPGLIAIALYMLVLAGVVIIGVVGGHYPWIFLLMSVGFLASSFFLVRLYRWAWALTLAAVLLLAIYNIWIFSSLHAYAALVQGLLNLVFFLYLVRTEVRERLR
jgi:hypothetical protein